MSEDERRIGILTVTDSLLIAALRLPFSCEILDARISSTRIGEIELKVRSPDLLPVAEGGVVPKVVGVFKQECRLENLA